ncbi:protein AUXIN RESPONSE 4 [Euphorbia lathyris]|uniref:protein AUXIN RESPONSE 4 n=1 Tax=Euphorbia lathyris TaxID=212925 RepID=UPI003313E761
MAIITEEQQPEPQLRHRNVKKEPTLPPDNPNPNPYPNSKPKSDSPKQDPTSPFTFWFYFTLSVSLITLSTITLYSFTSSSDPRSFFLSLSTPLRHHYSKGRVIKVQLAQTQKATEIFALESENRGQTEKLVILHGLGLSSFSFRKVIDILGSKGIHGVAFDLPGNGFSDKSMEVLEERGDGVFERFSDVYALIKEKGIFWAFDNMVETGELPYQEIISHYSKLKSVVKPIVLDSEEMGKVLGQVIETLGLAPVHLVLHDSSLTMVANWVLQNSNRVRSITILDTMSNPALPLWILKMPVLRELVLGSNLVYQRLIQLYCSKGFGGFDSEAHRVMLKGRDGRRAVLATGKKLNTSFSVAEWGNLDVIKGIPIQVIWSNTWSTEWSQEGQKVAEALPQAKFVWHSGGRWPQEDGADELGENIVKFVSSLPKSDRKNEEEPIPDHIQKLLDEAKAGEHHHGHGHGHGHSHGHGHDGHDHHHIHSPGYMDAYGLGHGWGT